jgi:acetoin utilization deacetylase AcuC-like enzyme
MASFESDSASNPTFGAENLTRKSPKSPLRHEPSSEKVGIFFHEACVSHSIPDHVERPQRVTSILKYLQTEWSPQIFHHSTQVSEEQILLFHEAEHLQELKEYFDESEQKKKIVKYDGDTQVCPQTRAAVLHSAGSIINAIDRMYLPKEDPLWLR